MADNSTTAVQFTLTGGLGYTPVIVHGLARPDGWLMEKNVDGDWQSLSQAVHGNDYWQTGVVRPDLVLADLTAILHPELDRDHQFHFYRKATAK